MSRIIEERLKYLDKGLFSSKWQDADFELCSNGVLTKITHGGAHKHPYDLKPVAEFITTGSARDYSEDIDKSMFKRKLSNFSKAPPTTINRSFSLIDDTPIELEDAYVLHIPQKPGSKKATLILLFRSMTKLNEWFRNIKKWASLPKIIVESASSEDLQTVGHNVPKTIVEFEYKYASNKEKDKDKIADKDFKMSAASKIKSTNSVDSYIDEKNKQRPRARSLSNTKINIKAPPAPANKPAPNKSSLDSPDIFTNATAQPQQASFTKLSNSSKNTNRFSGNFSDVIKA